MQKTPSRHGELVSAIRANTAFRPTGRRDLNPERRRRGRFADGRASPTMTAPNTAKDGLS
jgi:hypothetical protein